MSRAQAALARAANSLTGSGSVGGFVAGSFAFKALARSPRARFEYHPTQRQLFADAVALRSLEPVLPYRELDVGELLELLTEAVPDAEARCAILADNPARLYGFDRKASS